jgi:threo-3-hydroxy-L-aspartate ammonia-lyase
VLGLDDVVAAAAVLEGVAHRTPVLRSRTLDQRVGAEVLLKVESLQRAGSFKFRGAAHRVSTLTPDERQRGVVAGSSGNHGSALALAGRLAGVPVTIVMPEDGSPLKRAAIEGYGGTVVPHDRYASRNTAIAADIAAETGAVLVPPYDDWRIMAGAGTTALELLDEAGPLDVFVAPVSGGGLMAGCATVVAARRPGTRVVGVEPAAADDTHRSLAAGERVETPVGRTICDGLQTVVSGRLTWRVNSRLVDDVVLVDDDEVVDAMRFAFERLKLVLEPSGAASLAAVLHRGVARGRTGVVLSGGNVDAGRFAELVGPR